MVLISYRNFRLNTSELNSFNQIINILTLNIDNNTYWKIKNYLSHDKRCL